MFEKEQPLAQAVTEMYGHGLQTGQALRNIILDPANPTAYKNMDSALKAYDEASALANGLASGLATGTPVQAALALVAQARIKQQAARERVLALAKTDTPAAIALLNKEETPAWRTMRTALLEAGKLARASLQATRDHALAETRQAVVQVSSASREIATGNANLSHRTEQQAASLEQTSASMEQMNDELKQSAESARQASQLAVGATAVAEKGGQVVGEVVRTMDEIRTSSHKIAEHAAA